MYTPPNILQPVDRQDASEEGIDEVFNCDLCDEECLESEGRPVYAGDESLDLCEGCAEHYLE